MAMSYLPILFSGLASAIATAAFVPLAIRAAHRWDVLDEPNHRKDHAVPIPRLGGLAVGGGFAVGLLVAFLFGALAETGLMTARGAILLLATASIFLVGLLDDSRRLTPGIKFTVQIAAAKSSAFHLRLTRTELLEKIVGGRKMLLVKSEPSEVRAAAKASLACHV